VPCERITIPPVPAVGGPRLPGSNGRLLSARACAPKGGRAEQGLARGA
jgi:hypothetical protein